MSVKFKTARFHVEYGPESLFKRVRWKMSDVVELSLSGGHFQARLQERNIPKKVVERLEQFNIKDWKLVTCEIRKDKGKFINSTWETVWQGQAYWITIGFNNHVQTIVAKDGPGFTGIVKNGELYDFVDLINKKLLQEDGIILKNNM